MEADRQVDIMADRVTDKHTDRQTIRHPDRREQINNATTNANGQVYIKIEKCCMVLAVILKCCRFHR